MFTRPITSVVLLFCIFLSAVGKDNTMSQLGTWANEMPSSIDGIKIYAPVEDNEKVTISDIIDCPGSSADSIFVKVLTMIRENFDDDMEELDNLDVKSRRVLLHRTSTDEKTGISTTYSIAFQCDDELLSFFIFNISVNYKEKGILPRSVKIEKLKPLENRNHKDLVEKSVFLICQHIQKISNATKDLHPMLITHWKEIEDGIVCKGMNPSEVILIKGLPHSDRTMGSRRKWMYGNEDVIIFTDGIVSNII